MQLSESDKAKLGRPGWIIVNDGQGNTLRPPDETSDFGDDTRKLESKPVDMTAVAEHMRATAPVIVKTSGQSKAERLMAMFLGEVRSREAGLGRKMVLGDFSEQWLQALRIDLLRGDGMDLTTATEMTPEVLRRVAEYYCQEEANKVAHHKGKTVRDI